MTVFDFANAHPIVALFMVWALCSLVVYPLKLVNRYIRHKNIKECGWPPAHLDADGDAIKSED